MTRQLADVVIHPNELTVPAAAARAAAILAELPGCALVAVGVAGRVVLLAARPDQPVVVAGDDIVGIALAAYESLLANRSLSSLTFRSPLRT
jgi:hypothetical protein